MTLTQKTKTFIILHGSWQSSEGWKTVADLMSHAGFPVMLIDLPGHGTQADMGFHKINLQTYVNYVCQQVQAIQRQTPVVLVAHSMSGMIISQVAQNIPIHQLMYISAFLPVNGECLLDIAKRSPVIGISKNMMINRIQKSINLDKNGIDKLFYNDCPPEVTQVALSRLQEEPLLPFYGHVRLTQEKFGRTPKVYIECLKDFTVCIELQRFMHSRWACTVQTLDSGHAPFYAAPEQLARILIHSLLE